MIKHLKDSQGVAISPIQPQDLAVIWELAYGQQENIWMKWNGPYFKDKIYSQEEFVNVIGKNWLVKGNVWAIKYQQDIVGTVSYQYVDGELKRWLEIGICIYQPEYWHKGIATVALSLWVDYLFEHVTDLPHIGFTTWSGNQGMMRVGEKVGMTLEARIRKVRYWDNQYWDAIKYGILREEWS